MERAFFHPAVVISKLYFIIWKFFYFCSAQFNYNIYLIKIIYSKIADYLAEVVSALVQRRIGVEEALPPLYDMYLVTKLLMGGAK